MINLHCCIVENMDPELKKCTTHRQVIARLKEILREVLQTYLERFLLNFQCSGDFYESSFENNYTIDFANDSSDYCKSVFLLFKRIFRIFSEIFG